MNKGAGLLRSLVLGLFLSNVSLNAVFAEEPEGLKIAPIEVVNLNPADLLEAEQFAEKWIAENREAVRYDDKGKKILQEVWIEHFGPYLPKNLRYILTALDKADFRVHFHQTTEQEMTESLNEQANESRTLLRSMTQSRDALPVSPEMRAGLVRRLQLGFSDTAARARVFLKDLFGMPNGFTFFVKVSRTAAEKKADTRMANKNVAIGTATFTLSLFLKDTKLVEHLGSANIATALPFLTDHLHQFHAAASLPVIMTFAGWVWLNMYHNLWIGEFQSQGRDVKRVGESLFRGIQRVRSNLNSDAPPVEAEAPRWKVIKKPLFQRMAVFGRSVLTNSLIMASQKLGFALLEGFAHASWSSGETLKIFSNSLWTLFSRYAFEEWLTSKQPRAMQDGSLVEEPGRYSPQTIRRIRFWFEIINGQIKWLHLFGVPHADNVLPLMAAVGTINTLYDNRFWFQDSFAQVKDWLRYRIFGTQPPACLTLLRTSAAP